VCVSGKLGFDTIYGPTSTWLGPNNLICGPKVVSIRAMAVSSPLLACNLLAKAPVTRFQHLQCGLRWLTGFDVRYISEEIVVYSHITHSNSLLTVHVHVCRSISGYKGAFALFCGERFAAVGVYRGQVSGSV
jgi:hypothetical protein